MRSSVFLGASIALLGAAFTTLPTMAQVLTVTDADLGPLDDALANEVVPANTFDLVLSRPAGVNGNLDNTGFAQDTVLINTSPGAIIQFFATSRDGNQNTLGGDIMTTDADDSGELQILAFNDGTGRNGIGVVPGTTGVTLNLENVRVVSDGGRGILLGSNSVINLTTTNVGSDNDLAYEIVGGATGGGGAGINVGINSTVNVGNGYRVVTGAGDGDAGIKINNGLNNAVTVGTGGEVYGLTPDDGDGIEVGEIADTVGIVIEVQEGARVSGEGADAQAIDMMANTLVLDLDNSGDIGSSAGVNLNQGSPTLLTGESALRIQGLTSDGSVPAAGNFGIDVNNTETGVMSANGQDFGATIDIDGFNLATLSDDDSAGPALITNDGLIENTGDNGVDDAIRVVNIVSGGLQVDNLDDGEIRSGEGGDSQALRVSTNVAVTVNNEGIMDGTTRAVLIENDGLTHTINNMDGGEMTGGTNAVEAIGEGNTYDIDNDGMIAGADGAGVRIEGTGAATTTVDVNNEANGELVGTTAGFSAFSEDLAFTGFVNDGSIMGTGAGSAGVDLSGDFGSASLVIPNLINNGLMSGVATGLRLDDVLDGTGNGNQEVQVTNNGTITGGDDGIADTGFDTGFLIVNNENGGVISGTGAGGHGIRVEFDAGSTKDVTINNADTGAITGVGGEGISIDAGGVAPPTAGTYTIDNDGAITSDGNNAIEISNVGAADTDIDNSGDLESGGGAAVVVTSTTGGLDFENETGGVVDGAGNGILFSTESGAFTFSGAAGSAVTGDTAAAIDYTASGAGTLDFENNVGSTISGGGAGLTGGGVRVSMGAGGTITNFVNAGTIDGGDGQGVTIETDGVTATLTNTVTGQILGADDDAFEIDDAGAGSNYTVINQGLIEDQSGDGSGLDIDVETATVNNSGDIVGGVFFGIFGNGDGAGTSMTIVNSGEVRGGNASIFLEGETNDITNTITGDIVATAAAGVGINAASLGITGFSLDNAGAILADGADGIGVSIGNVASTIDVPDFDNSGLIRGGNIGVRFESTGTLTLDNFTGAEIRGDDIAAVHALSNLIVNNSGDMISAFGDGILKDGGELTVDNNATGRIIGGGGDGINGNELTAFELTDNDGEITGGVFDGISLTGVTTLNVTTFNNDDSGEITGANDGVFFSHSGAGSGITIDNEGEITGQGGDGIDFNDGERLEITNDDNGVISGDDNGVEVDSDAITTFSLNNDADIEGQNGDGVSFNTLADLVVADGQFVNDDNGSIFGGDNGVSFDAGANGSLDVNNEGSIEGDNGDGIDFAGGSGLDVANDTGATIEGGEFGISSTSNDIASFVLNNEGAISGDNEAGVGIVTTSDLVVADGQFVNDGSISGGIDGVRFNGGANSVLDINNDGDIEGDDFAGVNFLGGGTLDIANDDDGDISGGDFGVSVTSLDAAAVTISNDGDISGDDVAGVGIATAADVAAVVNNNDGDASISGGLDGISFAAGTGAMLSVENEGDINGDDDAGIDFVDGASLTISNGDGASITGGLDGVRVGGANIATFSLTNDGAIDGDDDAGVDIMTTSGLVIADGDFVNQSDGSITGEIDGVRFNDAAGSIDINNDGDISGDTGDGVLLAAGGGNVDNDSGASIEGGDDGIDATGAGVTGFDLENDGDITGDTDAGVDIGFAGAAFDSTVDNGSNGDIFGQMVGVRYTGDGTLTVENAGSIIGEDVAGVQANSNLVVDNMAGGVISSLNGDGVQKNNGGDLSVTNAFTASITGGDNGIEANGLGAADTFILDNSGDIVGLTDSGVNFVDAAPTAGLTVADGQFVNTTTGRIIGGVNGVVFADTAGGLLDINNDGEIRGGLFGVNHEGGDLNIQNDANGDISGDLSGVLVFANVGLVNSLVIDNGGTISGDDPLIGVGVEILTVGLNINDGDFVNRAGGLIEGGLAGIFYADNGGGNFDFNNNGGDVTGNVAGGIVTTTTGITDVDNNSGGRILGTSPTADGILIQAGAGNVTQMGITSLISGGDDGIDATNANVTGFDLDNQDGTIVGLGDAGVDIGFPGATFDSQVTNTGDIFGENVGVRFTGDGTMTVDNIGGTIEGDQIAGIQANSNLIVNNSAGGMIISPIGDGIDKNGGGDLIVNNFDIISVISGGDDGIDGEGFMAGDTVDIFNEGQIIGANDAGVVLTSTDLVIADGQFDNTDGALIQGQNHGVLFQDAGAGSIDINNQGDIRGVNVAGIETNVTTVIDNTNGGRIISDAGTGILLTGGDIDINNLTFSSQIIGNIDGINATGVDSFDLVNQGDVFGETDDAVDVTGTGIATTVLNSGSGEIAGQVHGILHNDATGTLDVDNSGIITGIDGEAIQTNAMVATILNQDSGEIVSVNADAIFSNGEQLDVVNDDDAEITGGLSGIVFIDATGNSATPFSLINDGDILGQTVDGVNVTTNGGASTILNNPNATIEGQINGVTYVDNGAGSLVLTNNSASILGTDGDGVNTDGFDVTINNLDGGTITGLTGNGITDDSPTLVVNQDGAASMIFGETNGILTTDFTADVTINNNGGDITGDTADGINTAGLIVTIANTGPTADIMGELNGISAFNPGATTFVLTNSGNIDGNTLDGVAIVSTGGTADIDNDTGGTITGEVNGISYTDATGTLTVADNDGLIDGNTGDGITTDALTVSITNGVDGDIFGEMNGISQMNPAGTLTVVNAGDIDGATGDGIETDALTVDITNSAGGTITGAMNGVSQTNAAGTLVVVNDALIDGGADDGIDATVDMATITNNATGVITGGTNGIDLELGTMATITNSGAIDGDGGDGIETSGGLHTLVLDNNAGATITGSVNGVSQTGGGIFDMAGAEGNDGTITGEGGDGINTDAALVLADNAGTITGTEGGLIAMTAGPDLLMTVNNAAGGLINGDATFGVAAIGDYDTTTMIATINNVSGASIIGATAGVYFEDLAAPGRQEVDINNSGLIQGGFGIQDLNFSEGFIDIFNDGLLANGEGIVGLTDDAIQVVVAPGAGFVKDVILDNDGYIIGNDDGVEMVNDVVFTGDNSGDIVATNGDGIAARNIGDLGSFTFVNQLTGTVTANDDGIDINDDDGLLSGPIDIDNFGDIEGGQNGILITNNDGVVNILNDTIGARIEGTLGDGINYVSSGNPNVALTITNDDGADIIGGDDGIQIAGLNTGTNQFIFNTDGSTIQGLNDNGISIDGMSVNVDVQQTNNSQIIGLNEGIGTEGDVGAFTLEIDNFSSSDILSTNGAAVSIDDTVGGDATVVLNIVNQVGSRIDSAFDDGIEVLNFATVSSNIFNDGDIEGGDNGINFSGATISFFNLDNTSTIDGFGGDGVALEGTTSVMTVDIDNIGGSIDGTDDGIDISGTVNGPVTIDNIGSANISGAGGTGIEVGTLSGGSVDIVNNTGVLDGIFGDDFGIDLAGAGAGNTSSILNQSGLIVGSNDLAGVAIRSAGNIDDFVSNEGAGGGGAPGGIFVGDGGTVMDLGAGNDDVELFPSIALLPGLSIAAISNTEDLTPGTAGHEDGILDFGADTDSLTMTGVDQELPDARNLEVFTGNDSTLRFDTADGSLALGPINAMRDTFTATDSFTLNGSTLEVLEPNSGNPIRTIVTTDLDLNDSVIDMSVNAGRFPDDVAPSVVAIGNTVAPYDPDLFDDDLNVVNGAGGTFNADGTSVIESNLNAKSTGAGLNEDQDTIFTEGSVVMENGSQFVVTLNQIPTLLDAFPLVTGAPGMVTDNGVIVGVDDGLGGDAVANDGIGGDAIFDIGLVTVTLAAAVDDPGFFDGINDAAPGTSAIGVVVDNVDLTGLMLNAQQTNTFNDFLNANNPSTDLALMQVSQLVGDKNATKAFLDGLASVSLNGVAELDRMRHLTQGLQSCGIELSPAPEASSCVYAEFDWRFKEFDRDDQVDYQDRTASFHLGGQMEVAPGIFLGAVIGYDNYELESGTAVHDGDAFRTGIVAKYIDGPISISGAVTGGFGMVDTTRATGFPGETAVGSYDTFSMEGRVKAAYTAEFDGAYVKPSLEGAITHISLDGFAESGAGMNNLTVGKFEETFFSIEPNIEVGADILFNGGQNTFRPYVRAGVRYVTEDSVVQSNQFSAALGNAFTTENEFDNFTGVYAVGGTVFALDNLAIKAEYSGEIGADTLEHRLELKANFNF